MCGCLLWLLFVVLICVGVVLTGVLLERCLVCVKFDWWSFGMFFLSPCVVCSVLDDVLLYLDCFFVCRCFSTLCVARVACVFCVICVWWFSEDIEGVIVMFDWGCLYAKL